MASSSRSKRPREETVQQEGTASRNPPPPVLPAGVEDLGDRAFSQSERECLETLHKRTLETGRFPCQASLNLVGLWQQVFGFLNILHWTHIAQRRAPTYSDITLELLSTFAVHCDEDSDASEPRAITFRLGGRRFGMTLDAFNSAFHFYTSQTIRGFRNFALAFNPEAYWQEITQSQLTYHSSKSKASHIVNPALRYFHRYITYSLSARGESNGNVTKTDLFFLWCLEKKWALNSGYWLFPL